jgi:hemolysin activation/secretion protein
MDWTAQWVSETTQWQDSLAHVNVAYHRGQTGSRSLYLGLDSTFSHNLRNGGQVSLGGINGLRGVDNHYLTGDHSTVLTVEQRLFTKTHLFNLARLGYAAFVDVGTTYGGERTSFDAEAGDIYSNVGFGLRLAPSKSENGQVIHIDLAYPISGDFQGQSRSLQFTAELKKSF